jgi:hypothetical protein
MPRVVRLVDLNPRWRAYDGRDGQHPHDAITFDCPEGHPECRHTIQFTPDLSGVATPVLQHNGAQWARRGDTFETLVLSPSIRVTPSARMLADGSIDHVGCAFHGFVGGANGQMPGQIEFCGDSK